MNSLKSKFQVITYFLIIFIAISLLVLYTYSFKSYNQNPGRRDHAYQSIIPRVGYVYAFGYWEQQANSLLNMLTLHCWAGHLNASLSVVAPFYQDGWPMTVSQLQESSAPQFSDLFDLEIWNHVTKRKYGVELVPWSHLLNKAQMKLITVEIIYWWDKSQDAHGLNRNKRITSGCKWKIENYDSKVKSFFHIVRRACINLSFGDKLTSIEFNNLVFGSYSPAEVSIIFQEWRSISSNPFRIPIGMDCGEEALYAEAIVPSSSMLQLASKYKQIYLNNSNYIAVMVRIEQAAITNPLPLMEAFLKKVLNASSNLIQQYGISNILLSMDIGRFGSATLRSKPLLSLGLSFFKKVTGNKNDISVWEKSFESVAGKTEPAVIARLQSTLVAQSTCAILAGGGMFQFQTALTYRSFHRNNYTCLIEIH